MNKFGKFLLIVISLIGILLTGISGLNLAAMYNLLPFNFPILFTSNLLTDNIYWGYTTLALVLILFVVFVLLFLMALFSKTTVKQLKIKNKNGELFVTKSAIENAIRYAVSDLPECRNAKVNTRLFKRNAKVIVYFENELTHLELTKELNAAIDERINKCINEMTGQDAKKIIIKFYEAKQQKKALKNQRVI